MIKINKNALTPSLPGGGLNNTTVCLKDNNYDEEFKRLDSFYRSFFIGGCSYER